MVYSTRRFVLCLTLCHFVLVFSVLLALRLPRLGKRELFLVLFLRLFDLCSFGFVGFLFLLVSWKGCGLLLWHSLDLSDFIVPRLFEEKWRDTVFGFPWGVVRGAWRVVRGAWRVVRGSEFLVGTLSP